MTSEAVGVFLLPRLFFFFLQKKIKADFSFVYGL